MSGLGFCACVAIFVFGWYLFATSWHFFCTIYNSCMCVRNSLTVFGARIQGKRFGGMSAGISAGTLG